jgi:hypothetical protein
VYFAVAGRVPVLLSLLLAENATWASPYNTKRIELSPLRPENIAEMARMPAFQLTEMTPASTDTLVMALRRATAGIPRLVQYMLAEMGGQQLPLKTPADAEAAVRRVGWLLATQKKYSDHRAVLSSPAEQVMMAQLLAHDIFNVALPPRAMATEKQRLLLEASAWLPVMFELPADGRGSVPRVALAVVPELADAPLPVPDAPKFWSEYGQTRAADAAASILRGLLPYLAHARLDNEMVVPLTRLVPWLPSHLQHIGVHANSIELKQLLIKKTPKAEDFAARETANAQPVGASISAKAAANADNDETNEESDAKEKGGAEKKAITKLDYVVEVDNWFSDPRFHGKALVLRPPSNSNIPDVFFYVPASALRRLPGAPKGTVLRTVLIQELVNQQADTAFTADMFKEEAAKALKGDVLAAFDNVFLVLADKLGSKLKPGLQKSSGSNMYSIVADPKQFHLVAPRRPDVNYL